MTTQRQVSPVASRDADTAPALLSLHAHIRPDAIFISESSWRAHAGLGAPRFFTYAEADLRAAEIAGLFLELGLQPRDLIAVQLPHIAEQQIVLLGAWRAGLRVSVLPLLWRHSEIARAFAMVPPKAVITAGLIGDYDHALVMRDLAAATPSVRHVLGMGEPLPDGVAALDPLFDGEPFVRGVFDNEAADAPDSLILWTASAEADVVPVRHRQHGLAALGRLCVEILGIGAEDRILSPYPPTGLAGMGLGSMAALAAGASLMPHPPFDYPAFAAQLTTGGATHLVAPSAVLELLAADGLIAERASLDAIACVWPGPRRSYPPLATDAMSAPLCDVHNLAQLALSIRRRATGDDPAWLPLGRIGASSAVETRVRGSVRNGGLRHKLLGELYVRGAAVTPQDDAGLAFVNTRIACAVDEETSGFVRCERDARMIHHGGFALCAAELDRAYAECPGLLDAAAFSLPDGIFGERLFAAVVPRPGASPSIETLAKHLAMREVAPYKIPDQLVIVQRIPRAADGAVLRDDILAQV